ncbi:hybrid sensor histidine kinase/response regulator [Pseudomonas sp. LB3P31]
MNASPTGSAAQALIARIDWSHSPLGAVSAWPQSLKTAVDIVLHSPMPMLLLWGPQLTQIYNDGFALLAGSKHPRAFGQPAHLTWPELHEFTGAVLQGQVHTCSEQRFTLQRDGVDRDVWMDLTYSPIRDESAQVAGILVTATETNERTEQALRQSQTELQLIINAMPILISYVDREERFRLNNAAYLDWYGRTPEELYGRTIREVLGEDAYALRASHIAEALSGKTCCFGIDTRHRDGSYRHALMNYLPRHGADGAVNGFYIFVIDETERRKTELALLNLNETLEERVAARTQQLAEANQRLQNEMFERERAEDALRHAQKMEAVGQLTGGIAHDFNNMLTGIIGSLDLMQRYIADGRAAEIGRFTEAAVSSAHRAAALTHRLLAFSRRQSLDRKPLNANDLVRSLEDLLSRTKGDHIALRLHLVDDVWPVNTDASQLENALLNLVINARDAMPDNGELLIETANVYLEDSAITSLEPVKAGDYLMIAVSDNGTGMTPSVLAKAFDPFFTTKPIGQGTGLGLSMIYGFAQQSGGHVHIDSVPGEGTSVRLYLPRLQEPAPQDTLPAFSGETPPANAGETVVLVEDDPAVRMLVLNLLKELGYRAHEAQDAMAALPLLESDARIDLLVTDVGLPGMNGRQLAEIARQRRPGLKVLFMTGYAEKAAERQGFLEQGMDMVAKPFSIDLLANKIRTMLGQPG